MDPVLVAQRIDAAADCLTGLSFSLVDTNDLPTLRAVLNRVRGSFQWAEAQFVTRVGELSRAGHAPDPDDEQQRGGHSSKKEARRTSRNAEVLHRFPALAAALTAGKVSMEHVDALAIVWGNATPTDRSALEADHEELAAQACRMSVNEFWNALRKRRDEDLRDKGESKELRERRKNKASASWNMFNGRFEARLDLDAATGKAFETAVNAEIDRMIRDNDLHDVHPDLKGDRGHLRAYAIVNLASRGFQMDTPTLSLGARTELVVMIDAHTLQYGEHTGTICETVDGVPIPVSLARRLACDAGIIPAVLSSNGELLDLGRTTRLASRAQRRGCASMYKTCAAPGCETPFDRCEIHHSHWWENGGSTDMSNLVPLCGRHHHLIHDAGFTATLVENRTLRWYRPDGTLDAEQPLRPRAAKADTSRTDASRPNSTSQAGEPPGSNSPGRPGSPGDSRPATAPPPDTANGAGEQLTFTA